MRVVFRADASLEIGSGHVMRCLALGDALRERGAEIVFICREHPGHLCDYIRARGYEVLALAPDSSWRADAATQPPVHASFLATTWRTDATQSLAALNGSKPADWLVVDHYALDARWESAVRPAVMRIMAIDDLADRPHDCDILLDQNLHMEADDRYEALLPARCLKLIGPRYALLRPGYSRLRQTLRNRDGRVSRVLVFLGGVDKEDLTSRVIDVLQPHKGLEVDIVVGQNNPRRQEIERRCIDSRGFHYFCQVNDIEMLMARADLAIGGGGVALLERCALGLPTILLSLADNQLSGCRALARRGGALFVDASTESLAAALRICRASVEFVAHMAEQAAKVTDGKGLGRVIDALLGESIALRRATPGDCELIWQWRNDPLTRRYSGDGAEIDIERHRAWYAAILADEARDLLIGADARGDVGVLRYDVDGDEALISVYLVPARHGQARGVPLLESGTAWIRNHRPGLRRIRAVIGATNTASVRAFEAAGFEPNAHVHVKKLD